tara:strand:- start:1323 stop:2225 length:903 start_codon:yes stop_codon:yes gene_type:complete
MKLKLIAIALIFIASAPLKAQYEMDMGIQLGGANYLGDIGGFSGQGQGFIYDFRPEKTNIALSAFYRYSFSRNLALKFTAGFARIQGADSTSGNPARVGRNLSFRTDLLEAAVTGEYAFYQKRNIVKRARKQVNFKARTFAGIGALLYYPFAQSNEQWFALRPLQTEGQSYSEMTVIVPMGMAFDFTFNYKIRLGMEFGYRFTFTDYLDDVSTVFADPKELPFIESAIFANRSAEAFAKGSEDLPDPKYYTPGRVRGNPDNNDGYFVAQITLSYIIKASKDFYVPKKRGIFKNKRIKTAF